MPALADESTQAAVATDPFAAQYTAMTKQILLSGMELERFNLQYRLATIRQPKSRAWRYSAAQEAEAGGLLAFEIIGDKQFGQGRSNPMRVGQSALHGGLKLATVSLPTRHRGWCRLWSGADVKPVAGP